MHHANQEYNIRVHPSTLTLLQYAARIAEEATTLHDEAPKPSAKDPAAINANATGLVDKRGEGKDKGDKDQVSKDKGHEKSGKNKGSGKEGNGTISICKW